MEKLSPKCKQFGDDFSMGRFLQHSSEMMDRSNLSLSRAVKTMLGGVNRAALDCDFEC